MPIHKARGVAKLTLSTTPACQGNVEPEMPQKPQVAKTMLLDTNTYTGLCLHLIQPLENI